jgi:hypothetical protein
MNQQATTEELWETAFSTRIKVLVMDLEETEARNKCAGEAQQQFN